MSVNEEQDIIQNLIDAGCRDELIESFMADVRGNKFSDGMKLLEKHRRKLLDDLHKEQKKIDCLDYLVYRMKKENSV